MLDGYGASRAGWPGDSGANGGLGTMLPGGAEGQSRSCALPCVERPPSMAERMTPAQGKKKITSKTNVDLGGMECRGGGRRGEG